MRRAEEPTADPGAPAAPPPSRLQRWIKRAWWLHSVWALAFGVGVMIVARKGLDFADSLLMVLGISWVLMFLALRFIVGPTNRRPEEGLTRRGFRILTNYVIKNLYQQMFFFLVPLYASSSTWSFASWNWWLAPILLVCAVLSTMDLVFDNWIMEKRAIASCMYGFALFGVLNLMLPLVTGIGHFPALLASAAATAPAVALLNFRVKSVISGPGLTFTFAGTLLLFAAAWFGRAAVPPAPLSLVDASVGHGTTGSYECLPPPKRAIRADRLDALRCGSVVTEPGGIKDEIVHVWRKGRETLLVVEPSELPGCDGTVIRSYFPRDELPSDPTGKWSCRIETADRQLVGVVGFEVTKAPPAPEPDADPQPDPTEPDPTGQPDGGSVPDAPPAAPDDAG